MERRKSMVGIHSNSVGSCLSNEEEAAILPWISSTPAAHSVDSWTNSFLAPVHQRSVDGRTLDDRATGFDSEQPARTWDDEKCFERIMWSVKEISSDFLTASYDGQDNCCQLSENWFQRDARHYDEEQKKPAPKEQQQLPRLKDLEDLHKKFVTKILWTNLKLRTLLLQGGEGRRVRQKMTQYGIHGLGFPSLKTSALEYLLVSTEETIQAAPK